MAWRAGQDGALAHKLRKAEGTVLSPQTEDARTCSPSPGHTSFEKRSHARSHQCRRWTRWERAGGRDPPRMERPPSA